jgi:hypothetical protein
MPEGADTMGAEAGQSGQASAENLLLLGELRGKQDAMAGELRSVKEELEKVRSKVDQQMTLLYDIQSALKGLPERVSTIETRCVGNHARRQEQTGAHKKPLDRTVGELLGEYFMAVLKIVGVGMVLAVVLYAMQSFLATKAPLVQCPPVQAVKEAAP